MDRLNGLGREFSADLKARDGDSQLISKSTLAGGFMHLLCSLVTVTEAATTSRNRWEVEKEYTAYNIAAHFKYILICRLQELVGEILNILRFEDQAWNCHIVTLMRTLLVLYFVVRWSTSIIVSRMATFESM